MTMPDGPPPDHRVGRQVRLRSFLRISAAVTVGLCTVAVAVPDAVGRTAGVGVVTVLIAVPVVRVVWLMRRWLRRGDRRYAMIAGGLLLIVGAASLAG